MGIHTRKLINIQSKCSRLVKRVFAIIIKPFGACCTKLKTEMKTNEITNQHEDKKPPNEQSKTNTVKPTTNNCGQDRKRGHGDGKCSVPGTTGLQNLGNTCYMNAVIQCFSATDVLKHYFVSDRYKDDLKRRVEINARHFGTNGDLTERLAKLYKALWTSTDTQEAITGFKAAVDRFGCDFRGFEQHDAQEFFFWVLDKVHEDLNIAPERTYETITNNGQPDETVAAETLANYVRCNNSFFQNVFQGQFRSSLACPGCGERSNTFDPVHCLSVPLPQLPALTLEQCFEHLTMTETLGEDDIWKCPRCEEYHPGEKTLGLWSLPDVLVVHLKRFRFKQVGTNFRMIKLNNLVNFPIRDFDVTPNMARKSFGNRYDLYAVCYHHGKTLEQGHYTSTCKNSYDGQWYCFNDRKVSHVPADSIEECIVNNKAYMLFYKRQKIDGGAGDGSSVPQSTDAVSESVAPEVAVKVGATRLVENGIERASEQCYKRYICWRVSRRISQQRNYHRNDRRSSFARHVRRNRRWKKGRY